MPLPRNFAKEQLDGECSYCGDTLTRLDQPKADGTIYATCSVCNQVDFVDSMRAEGYDISIDYGDDDDDDGYDIDEHDYEDSLYGDDED